MIGVYLLSPAPGKSAPVWRDFRRLDLRGSSCWFDGAFVACEAENPVWVSSSPANRDRHESTPQDVLFSTRPSLHLCLSLSPLDLSISQASARFSPIDSEVYSGVSMLNWASLIVVGSSQGKGNLSWTVTNRKQRVCDPTDGLKIASRWQGEFPRSENPCLCVALHRTYTPLSKCCVSGDRASQISVRKPNSVNFILVKLDHSLSSVLWNLLVAKPLTLDGWLDLLLR